MREGGKDVVCIKTFGSDLEDYFRFITSKKVMHPYVEEMPLKFLTNVQINF